MKSAQKIALMLMVGLVLVGCKTAGDRFGNGPITISSNVERGYQKYLKGPGPDFFAISEDGRTYGYSYCSWGSGSCHSSPGTLAVSSCEKRTNVPCKVYARGRFVVWDGPVTIGNSRTKKGTTPATKSADVVCGYAVDYSAEKPRWTTLQAHTQYVKEAKRRGFSLEKCDSVN